MTAEMEMPAATVEVLNPRLFDIDGLTRSSTSLRGSVSPIEIDLESDLGGWAEKLKIGQTFQFTGIAQVVSRTDGYKPSEDGETAARTIVIRVDSIDPE